MSEKEINLLPPERRRGLRRDAMLDWAGRALNSLNLALWLVTCVAGVLIVIMAGAVWQGSGGEEYGKLVVAVKEYQDLREEVAEKNQLFGQAAAVGHNRIVWSDALRRVVPNLPPAKVSEFRGVTKVSDEQINEATLTITGQAPTRGTLTSITDRLRDLDIVKEVKSPTSNLLDALNPRFELVLELNVPVYENN